MSWDFFQVTYFFLALSSMAALFLLCSFSSAPYSNRLLCFPVWVLTSVPVWSLFSPSSVGSLAIIPVWVLTLTLVWSLFSPSSARSLAYVPVWVLSGTLVWTSFSLAVMVLALMFLACWMSCLESMAS